MSDFIDRQALAELCPEIDAILEAECRAGNYMDSACRVGDPSVWPKPGSIEVHMHKKFLTDRAEIPAHVKFGSADYQCGIGDHYQCELHDHIIMSPPRPG
jgi:hypothetical protein